MGAAVNVCVVFSVTKVITVCLKQPDSHTQNGSVRAAEILVEGCS